MELLQEYFAEHYEPRLPFTKELMRTPRRSVYYASFLVTSTLATSILLIYSLQYCMAQLNCFRCLNRLQRLASIPQFFLLVVPFLIGVLDYPLPQYAGFALKFDAFCCLTCAACCLHKHLRNRRGDRLASAREPAAPDVGQSSPGPTRNESLTMYRSVVYLSTAVCIFARDQPCWRNEFSKADTFGTGLMDVGLGCFIVCVGSLGPTALRARAEVNRPVAMKKAGAQFLLLAVCGLVKAVSVVAAKNLKSIEFESAWREYGIHWNAFFSLAVAKLGGTAVELYVLPDWLPPLVASLVAGVGYEALLGWGGVAEFVVAPGKSEPFNRDSLLGANREGVFSMPGLAVLYLLGLQLGRWTGRCASRIASSHSGSGSAGAALRKLFGQLTALLIGCLVYRVLLRGRLDLLLPESRRLLNLSYAVWIAAFSAFCLAIVNFLLAAMLFLAEPHERHSSLAPHHLSRVDSAGLMYFLVSNLLTGLTNPLIKSVASDLENLDGWPCFAIVLVYMAVVYPAALAAQRLISVRALIGLLTSGLSSCSAVCGFWRAPRGHEWPRNRKSSLNV